jgi:hypothetical protein
MQHRLILRQETDCGFMAFQIMEQMGSCVIKPIAGAQHVTMTRDLYGWANQLNYPSNPAAGFWFNTQLTCLAL